MSSENLMLEPIEGLKKDIIKGVDISSLITLEQSGVTFYNEAGSEEDLVKLLADNEVNYARIRVWNDPYDEEGNGYGGGNNDIEKAIEIGKRATEANMRVFLDFHYSDFWADPSKQQTPKAWLNMDFDEKKLALYEFTKQSLQSLLDAGVDIGMVQIGNETNFEFVGEEDWNKITELFKAGSQAIREISNDIKVVLHFANPETDGLYEKIARTLFENDVDYDVFATSYYSFWHGTLENLKDILAMIVDTYDKEILVAETSYAYTLDSGDGFDKNIITPYSKEDPNIALNYPISEKGQIEAIRDIYQVVSNFGDKGLGVFYWEPAWLPVGKSEDLDENEIMWEKYGSGWASSYSGSYDPEDAGQIYGGNCVDNQALFDFYGKPLDSLKVFKSIETELNLPLNKDRNK